MTCVMKNVVRRPFCSFWKRSWLAVVSGSPTTTLPARTAHSPLIRPSSTRLACCTKLQSLSLHTTSYQRHYDKVDLSKENCMFYDDFKSAVEKDEILVIDVRRQDEVDKGRVPAKRYGHVHIEELDEALKKLSDADFTLKYGFSRPKKDAPDVVFFCRLGIRSSRAVKIAKEAGYERPRHYPGGWAVWQVRQDE